MSHSPPSHLRYLSSPSRFRPSHLSSDGYRSQYETLLRTPTSWYGGRYEGLYDGSPSCPRHLYKLTPPSPTYHRHPRTPYRNSYESHRNTFDGQYGAFDDQYGAFDGQYGALDGQYGNFDGQYGTIDVQY